MKAKQIAECNKAKSKQRFIEMLQDNGKILADAAAWVAFVGMMTFFAILYHGMQ